MYTYPKAPRDRRQHKRVLTLRNAGRAAIALIAVFVAVSLISEWRGPDEGEHGRLYEARTRQVELPKVAELTPVVEKPVEPAAGADPLLLSAAAREQYLDVDFETAQDEPQFIAASSRSDLPRLGGGSFVDIDDDQVARAPSRPLRRTSNGRLVIAGGPEGVAIQQH